MEENWKDRRYVARYNSLYATPQEEFLKCAELLRLGPEDRLIDFGCGNGDFLAVALKTVSSAMGLDLSENQLGQAALRFKGDNRVELKRSAFLDLAPGPRTFTKGFSRKALHHLTDPEKKTFFTRAGKYFEKKALFLLEDGIFDFERADLDRNWPGLMKDCEAYYGSAWERKKKDVSFCFKEEYPTGIKAWTAAFAAGGFKIIKRERRSSFYGSLLAEKE